MKYLILKFQGAGLFNNHKGTKDKIINDRKSGGVDRLNGNFKEPITVYQISNVIHCLFGERPVPTFRDVFYKPINYYFNKAKDSFLKIDDYKPFNKYTNQYEFYKEKISIKKAVWNSWSKQSEINWFKIKKYLINDDDTSVLDFFIDETNKLFNCDVRKITIYELRNKYLSYGQSSYKHITDFLLKNQKTTLVDFLTIIDYKNDFNRKYYNGISRTINNGIDDISKLNGYIYVPVNDDDIERLKKISNGTCTILDGGIVYIESIKEHYELQGDGFIKVSDISIDRMENKEKKERKKTIKL